MTMRGNLTLHYTVVLDNEKQRKVQWYGRADFKLELFSGTKRLLKTLKKNISVCAIAHSQ
jgi:hypothetical protein